MQKLILLSVILATVVIPASIARRDGPHAYGPVLASFSMYVAVYVVLLLFVYPRLF